jgi:hypothetical protein
MGLGAITSTASLATPPRMTGTRLTRRSFPGASSPSTEATRTRAALRSDGTVWVCGLQRAREPRTRNTNAVNTYPTQVPGLTGVVAISAAGYSSYALKSDGTVWSWGYNAFGNLGDGTSNPEEFAGAGVRPHGHQVRSRRPTTTDTRSARPPGLRVGPRRLWRDRERILGLSVHTGPDSAIVNPRKIVTETRCGPWR